MHRGGFTLGVQLRMGGSNVPWSDPQRNGEGDIPHFFRCARDLLYSTSNSTPGQSSPTALCVSCAMCCADIRWPLVVAQPIREREVPKKGDAPWQVFVMTDSEDVRKRLKSKFLSKYAPLSATQRGALRTDPGHHPQSDHRRPPHLAHRTTERRVRKVRPRATQGCVSWSCHHR